MKPLIIRILKYIKTTRDWVSVFGLALECSIWVYSYTCHLTNICSIPGHYKRSNPHIAPPDNGLIIKFPSYLCINSISFLKFIMCLRQQYTCSVCSTMQQSVHEVSPANFLPGPKFIQHLSVAAYCHINICYTNFR